MKKTIALGLAALMAVSMFAGCGGGTSSSSSSASTESKTESSSEASSAADTGFKVSDPGVFPVVDEKVTYKIMAPQTTYITDLNTNDTIKFLEDKTNVHIEFELVSENAMKEKVNLTLASNKLPDAFLYCGISNANLVKYGEQGAFIALNDMIEKHGSAVKTVFNDNPLLPESITAPDGNIYGLPNINECYHCFYSGRAWINEQWLKNVGMEYPNTTDELYNVLKAFKEKDANGNGDPNDEIPMMGADAGWNTRPYDFLLGSFMYNDRVSRLSVKDGKISFLGDSAEFKEGLTYIKKLIDEQLLDPVSLTQTSEQFDVIAGNPDVINVGVTTAACWWSGMGLDATDPLQRSRQYVGLSPLKGPKGVRTVTTSEGGISPGHFVITNVCKNPEALFKWAECQYDPYVTTVLANGIENVNWKKPDAGVNGINGKPALYEKLTNEEPQNYAIPNVGIWNATTDFRAGLAVKDAEEAKWGVEPRLDYETRTHFEPYRSDEQLPSLILSADDSTERARLEVQITDYLTENIIAFLSGTKDLEKDWDAYVAEFEVLEVPKYLSLLQAGYDSQYGGK